MEAAPASPLLWARADAYLFDIDGTLLNVRDPTHYFAFQHAVRDVFGVESRIEGVPIHGNTDTGILRAVLRRAGLSDADIAAHLPRAIAQMCAEVTANAANIKPVVCPSIRELLERLRSLGKLLGVASGNFGPIGWTKLEAAGLRHFFAFGCFSDRHEFRADIFRQGLAEARARLGPSAAVCVMGDTPADILAAREVGIPVIAVSTGIYPARDLLPLSPDICVDCCAELFPQL
jgi:phosphoglycolate phosphatase-like HAD superfamily hydrolase